MKSDCKVDACGHFPVMADRAVAWVSPCPEGQYIDATVGLGGHTLALLTAGAGHILALDRDVSALDQARKRLEQCGYLSRVDFVHTQYRELAKIIAAQGWGKAQGLILDAGVSSLQLEDAQRGFSFVHDGPLDMRMDVHQEKDAALVVQRYSERELRRIIWEYGQEPMAGRIARRIVQERQKGPILTTGQLAEVVSKAYPHKRRIRSRNHPATKTFQAVRIAVNDELEGLQALMRDIPNLLAPGSRAVIITFHSLEDRIVKHSFRAQAKGCTCPPKQQVCTCVPNPRIKILTPKPELPDTQELTVNSRSRSAKMRVAEVL